jgi:mRNA interferase RelE/StbE
MPYSVLFTEKALKYLKKMDRYQAKLIISWIKKNLEGCYNPRFSGKALTGTKKEYWRYRLGNYRLIADIQDEKIVVKIIAVGHRKDIYKKNSF